MANDPRRASILGLPVAVTSYREVGEWVTDSCLQGHGRYVCISNVHMCMEAFDNQFFHDIVASSDLVVPDGMPLVWGLKILGEKKGSQIRGSDLLLHLCKECEKLGLAIGLYGGTESSLIDFKKFLHVNFPGLKISFHTSPPFRELTVEEKENYRAEINASNCHVLFVGIGCPKQEIWMAEQKDSLKCVMLGVGAAFDFFSGRKRHAPVWMQRAGLEWLFRLASDPRRLWKRYLKHNPRFVFHFAKQLYSEKYRTDQHQCK